MATPKPDDTARTSAAGMVGAIADERRRHHRKQTVLWCLLIAVPLLVLLGIGWVLLQDEARSALLREYSRQRPDESELEYAANPQITRRLEQADELKSSAQSESVLQSVPDLQHALDLLAEARQLNRSIGNLKQLQQPLRQAILDTPWMQDSDVMLQRKQRLLNDADEIAGLLDAGNVDGARQRLAETMQALADGQKDNAAALKTRDIRLAWMSAVARVPERLHSDSGFDAIRDRGRTGEHSWNEGKWSDAAADFAAAEEQLTAFLEQNLTVDEKADLLESDADRLAELEQEKAALQSAVTELQQLKSQLDDQVATVNRRELQAAKELREAQAELAQLQRTAKADAEEVARLKPMEKQLTETQRLLNAAEAESKRLAESLATNSEALRIAEESIASRDRRIESLRTTEGAGSFSVTAEVDAALQEMEDRLAVIGDEAAQTEVEDALIDSLVLLQRADSNIKRAYDEGFLPQSDRVQALQTEMNRVLNTVVTASRKRDELLAEQYEQLQQAVDQAQQRYDYILTQVLPTTDDAVRLKEELDSLIVRQQNLAAAWNRHTAKLNPPDYKVQAVDVVKTEVESLLAERQQAEFQRLRREGLGPAGAGIEFVVIPAGKFQMGSNEEDNEKPVHEVTITKPFFAGKYEVTIGQILQWLNSGARIKTGWIDFDSLYCPVTQSGSRYSLNASAGYGLGKSAKQPMVEISHDGAVAFCRWLSEQDSKFTYRLPTEAEWEYMARAGSTTAYAWGDACNGTQANIIGNYPHGTSTKGPNRETTLEVGTFEPNEFGLYDTIGNTWEWCADWYDSDYYATSQKSDPTGPSTGSSRVLRGGSWRNNAIDARSSYRIYDSPGSTYFYIGFRVVAE